LHRHALESVFAFCALKELAPLPRVSKQWAVAVATMRTLDAEIDADWSASSLALFGASASPLCRHVGCLIWHGLPLTARQLATMSARMTNLHGLNCSLTVDQPMLVFPPRLRTLTLFVEPIAPRESALGSSSASTSVHQLPPLDAAIAAVAALPLLEELTLVAWDAESCCLAPLTSAPALHSLTLELQSDVFDSSAVTDALRSMPHLRSLGFDPSPESFARLLQQPHTLKLESFRMATGFTAEHGASIAQLPSLTDLAICLHGEHTDFLRGLSHLRRLELDSCLGSVADPARDAERIMHSLHALVGLSELRLLGGGDCPLRFTADQLAACLPHMPLLTSLHLSHAKALGSLHFLSSGPVTRSLQKLELVEIHPRLPLSELEHLHALSVLDRLKFDSVFDSPLDEATLQRYRPPCLLMPALVQFIYQ
jgi:hypothetical protein